MALLVTSATIGRSENDGTVTSYRADGVTGDSSRTAALRAEVPLAHDNFILHAAPRVGFHEAAEWAVVAATKTKEAEPTATPTRAALRGEVVRDPVHVPRYDDGSSHDSVQQPSRDVVGSSGIEQFTAGYLDYGGNPAWLTHFIEDVLPCEGGPADSVQPWFLFGDYSGSGYVSPAQFHPASWASASGATGRSDPHNGYDVGANVAWWSNAVSDPWGSGGWPVCGHRGGW